MCCKKRRDPFIFHFPIARVILNFKSNYKIFDNTEMTRPQRRNAISPTSNEAVILRTFTSQFTESHLDADNNTILNGVKKSSTAPAA
jgi:hypothetical protein